MTSRLPRADNEWRHCDERAELVEQLIRQTSRANLAEYALRQVTEDGAYVEALLAQIKVLEQNIARLVNERSKAKAA